MARALLISNPAAARNSPAALDGVLRELHAAGWNTEPVSTTGPGDARLLAERGVRDGVEIVAVFGGDGTTMQAAAALVGTDVALGVIPGGTGNLLAGNLRVPGNPVRAARALARGSARRFDLGRVDRPGSVEYFAVACGAGYDARVMAATPAALKRRWGMAAYVATTLRLIGNIRSASHRIVIDGVRYDAHAAMVLVANCGEVIPPLIRLRPGILPDDGLLDVVVMRADNFSQSVRAVWDLLRVAPGLPGEGTWLGYARGRQISVESDPIEPVQLDGEPGGETPFTVTVVPGAIRIVVPARG
ncbi:MAG: diacylglycerol kinase family lipid kinase [Gemmatimonadales bacterium]|nr:diacylglycerol kinase family lipid kinase [Gemmatimonadales bacterium]